MRHPVSTPVGSGDFEGGLMLGGIVGFAVVPSAPEDADPGAGEDADGVGMGAAAGSGALVDLGGPGRGVSGQHAGIPAVRPGSHARREMSPEIFRFIRRCDFAISAPGRISNQRDV